MRAAHALVVQPAQGPDRRFWIGWILALTVLALAALTTTARSEPSGVLKGQWAVEVETPAGVVPLSIALRDVGQGGVLIVPAGMVEVEYRQDRAAFSISAELPGSISPTGSGATLILRGVQTSERAATGTAIFIRDEVGAADFEQTTGSFSATRQ